MYPGTVLEMEYEFRKAHLAKEVARLHHRGQVYSGRTTADRMRSWVREVRVFLGAVMATTRPVDGGPPIARTPTY